VAPLFRYDRLEVPTRLAHSLEFVRKNAPIEGNFHLYKKIIGAVAENPNCTAIVLGDKGSLTNMTLFPGAAVFERRLEQAIASTRTYDLKRVYGHAVRAD
jgi:hypothetical protein